jgi:hypothetical protein
MLMIVLLAAAVVTLAPVAFAQIAVNTQLVGTGFTLPSGSSSSRWPE